MEEKDKSSKLDKTNNDSSLSVKRKKVTTKKKKVAIEMSNEELLAAILDKKKQKAQRVKKASEGQTSKKVSTGVKSKPKEKEKKEEIDSSLLLDQILAKKKAKKAAAVKKDSIRKKVESEEVDLPKLKETDNLKEEAEKKDKSDEKHTLEITAKLDFEELQEYLKKEAEIEKQKQLEKEREFKERQKAIKLREQARKEQERLDKQKEKEKILQKRKEKQEAKKLKSQAKKEEVKQLRDLKQYQKQESKKQDRKSKEEQKKVERAPKQQKDNKKSISFKTLILSCLLICVFILSAYLIKQLTNSLKLSEVSNDNNEEVQKASIAAEKAKDKKYNECLEASFNENDQSEEMTNKINELNTYLKNHYLVSVQYEDLTRGFSYSYNAESIYYAASTIKALDALYIYQKAKEGTIDLDKKLVYSAKFKWGSSSFMKTKKYGDKISIRDLVKYAVMVSDNSAHQMLVDYIGRNNLKEFGQSLGAQNTLTAGDNFGNISVGDGIIYMKAIYEFINSSGSLGEELASYFINAEQNGLALEDKGIKAAHKYGEYNEYYHDIGIVYDNNPYVIAILSYEGHHDFINIIKDINNHVYELHQFYINNREGYCKNLAYGQ